MITVDAHPLLELAVLESTWPSALGGLDDERVAALASLDAEQPFPVPDDAHKKVVRDLFRHGGFKPAGRSKPCNEYIRAATDKGVFPRINACVDWTNLAALHGAIPVSTVDLDRTVGALRVGIAEPGTSYVFNRSGQEISIGGLICLFDETGPCANAVKDSQRTKTDDDSTRTLTLCWGTTAVPGRAAAIAEWLAEHWADLGVVSVLSTPAVPR